MKLEEIIARFGVRSKEIEKIVHAALTEVYSVEDHSGRRFILRGQPIEDGTIERFHRVTEIIKDLRPLIRLELPQLLTVEGENHLLYEDTLWTFYVMIEGKIICSWQDTYKAQTVETERLARALREIQRQTTRKIEGSEEKVFLDDIEQKFAGITDLLPAATRGRVEGALAALRTTLETAAPGQQCFVHGDFHHGNVIVNRGRPVGLVDLDWCRIAHPFEDLAFMSMMTLRDYRQKGYMHDDDLLEKILAAYGLDDNSRALFYDYLILCAAHDVYVFKYMIRDAANFYLEYQLRMLAELCRLY